LIAFPLNSFHDFPVDYERVRAVSVHSLQAAIAFFVVDLEIPPLPALRAFPAEDFVGLPFHAKPPFFLVGVHLRAIVFLPFVRYC
jgi:hypothetical protein